MEWMSGKSGLGKCRCRCEINNLMNDEWGLSHPLCSLLPPTLLTPFRLQDPLGPFFFSAVLRPPLPRDCRFHQTLLFSGLCFVEIANHTPRLLHFQTPIGQAVVSNWDCRRACMVHRLTPGHIPTTDGAKTNDEQPRLPFKLGCCCTGFWVFAIWDFIWLSV